MPRTVVLGATGFIGRALVNELGRRGAEAVGVGSAALDLRTASAHSALAAMLDSEDTLVVAAALTPPRGATLDGLVENVAIAAAVARTLEAHDVAQCVFVSSDAVYGWRDPVVDERSLPEPDGHYALGKLVGEGVLTTICATRHTPLLVLRVCGVFGPGDTHVAYGPTRFARTLVEAGRIELFGQGEEIRDTIFIDDVASVTADLIEGRATGVLNVASGESRTFAAMAERLREIAGGDAEIVSAPRAMPVRHRSYDITRLRATLPGFRPTPFDDAVERTLEYERERAGTAAR